MAAKSGLTGIPRQLSCHCLYVRYVWYFLYSVQGQLGYCSELEMLLQGRSGHYESNQWG